MKQSAAKQTLKITAINGVVRALGMLLRILLSRLLGAEIMGIAELAPERPHAGHYPADLRPAAGGEPHDGASARPEDRTQSPCWPGSLAGASHPRR